MSEADALNYHTLRVHSLKGLVQPIEAQVREELEAGAIGMARLLVRYGIEGTRVWGVFDDEVLAGVLCLSRRLGHEPSDAASLWGAYVLPRYRGTFVSRALMGAVMGWCDREPRIRSIVAQLPRVNVYARDYLERSGFRYCDDESAPGLVRMRRRI